MIGLSEEPRQDAAESQASAADPQVADLQVADSAADMRPIVENMKKRRLYRRATGEQVVWFPHDNHPDLLKEFLWESGQSRWVLHGTPASGAGIIGCLEMGVSVIALCTDEHHEKHLGVAVKHRAVEAMLEGSRVFKDEELQARALNLCPAKKEKKEKKDKMDKEDEKDENDDTENSSIEKDEKEDKKDNKGRNDQNDKEGKKGEKNNKDKKSQKDKKDNKGEKDKKDNKKDKKVKKGGKNKKDKKGQNDKKDKKDQNDKKDSSSSKSSVCDSSSEPNSD